MGTSYEGPAVYSHRVDDYLLFDISGLTSLGADPPMLQIYAPGLLQEPAVGEELWVSLTALDGGTQRVAALRGRQRGALLLASVSAAVPFDATLETAIEAALGVKVESQAACAYAFDQSGDVPAGVVVQLWDLVFGGTPAVRLGSESTGVVRLEGRDYNAWTSGFASHLGFTLQAR
jgi:hypothetical protein